MNEPSDEIAPTDVRDRSVVGLDGKSWGYGNDVETTSDGRDASQQDLSDGDAPPIGSADGPLLIRPDDSAEVRKWLEPEPESAKALFANILDEHLSIEIRGVSGIVKDGKLISGTEGNELFIPLPEEALQSTASDAPVKLYVGGCVELVTPIEEVPKIRFCGFGNVWDDQSDDRHEGGDDGLR